MKLSLKNQVLLVMVITFVISFAVLNIVHYRNTKQNILNDRVNEARNIRNILMATRRVYHHQFLESGIPLTDKTIGFLPAHALGKISKDFTNWSNSGMSFNNVSDRPRNPNNAADALELEAMEYFRGNKEEKERMVPFTDENGHSYYHFSMPIYVEAYCLKCHGEKENAPAAIRSRYDSSYDYQVGDLRGVMSIKLPLDEIEASMSRNLIYIGLTYLITLWVVLFLVYILVHMRILKGLDKLIAASSKISQGDLGIVLPESGQDEFDKVALAFNSMARFLQQRESEQQNIQQQLETVLNKLDVMVYVADISTHELLFVNQYAIDAIGEVPQPGEKCWEFLQQGQTEPCRFCTNDCLLDDQGNPGQVVVWEFQNTVNQRWYECRDQAFFWSDGRMVRLEVAVDITERKQTLKNQGEQAAIWNSLMTSTREGILGLDMQEVCTFCNPAALGMLGFKETSHIVGKNIHHLIHYKYADGKDYPQSRCRIIVAMENGKTEYVENEVFWHADGHAIPIVYHATPIREDNVVTGVIVTFEDISKQLETDKILRNRMLELEQFNQLAVGRELKMIALKQEINKLLREQGEAEKYRVEEE